MKVDIKNRRAKFDYELMDEFVAGIVLTGTEIKSIRGNKASIGEAYCIMVSGELFVRNMFIEEYANGGHYNHEPRQDRKLLLKRTELKKLEKKLKDKGLTVIPSKLFVNDKNLAKIRIHLAKGKKTIDKRDDLKSKDVQREMDRAMKR